MNTEEYLAERNLESQKEIQRALDLLVDGNTLDAFRIIIAIPGGNPTTCAMLDRFWIEFGHFYPKPSGRRTE